MLPEDIKKIIRSEDDDDYIKMKIVIDNKDKILGYLE
jgi:hypothetical protein